MTITTIVRTGEAVRTVTGADAAWAFAARGGAEDARDAALAALVDTETARDAALVTANYFTTRAAGAAATATGNLFTSDEDGGLAWYRRTDIAPNYVLIGRPGAGPVLTVAQAGTRASRGADYVCDGTADEVEINAAIVAANAAGGGEVIAVGDFATTSNVFMLDFVTLTLLPGSSITAAAGYTNALAGTGIITAVGKIGWKVRGGGTIDGRTNDILANGIEARPAVSGAVEFAGDPCEYFEIDGMTVKLRQAHLYHIWSFRGRNGRITRNTVDGGYAPSYAFDGTETQEGVECYGSTNMLVAFNHAQGIGGAAFNFPASTDTIGDTGHAGLTVIGNTGETCGRFIQALLTSDTTNGLGGMERCTFARNHGKDVHVVGIDIQIVSWATDGDPIPFHDNDVSDNVIEMAAAGQVATARGLYVNNQRALAGVESSGNSFNRNRILGVLNTDNGGRVMVNGLSGFEANDNKAISPAQASGNASGFLFQECRDFIVTGNRPEGARLYGMHLIGCSGGVVARNHVREWNQAAIGTAGIFFEDGVAPCSDIRVIENDFATATLTGVGALVNIAANSTRFDYADNGYLGSAYTGQRTVYTGTNPMNLGLLPEFERVRTLVPVAGDLFPDMARGRNFTITLGADAVLNAPTNYFGGESGTVIVKQDATGGRTLFYNAAWLFPGGQAAGGTISSAANAVDVIRYVVQADGTVLATLHKAFAA